MLSENRLQQRHARCWACSRHPSAAAQHSFDVRTALHGSVLSASRQASRRKKFKRDLTFNASMGQGPGNAQSLLPTEVPPDRSAPSSRPAGKFCGGLPSGARWCAPTGDHLWLSDEESIFPLLDARTAITVGRARIKKRSHGSKRHELSAVPQLRKWRA